jgi:hypothetical protein
MHASITVAVLLLAIVACSRRPVVQPPSAPPLALQRSAPDAAVLKSNEEDPLRFCLVGTKGCAPVSEFGTCLLATGRCNADAHIQYASAEIRLQLESPVTGGARPEIILPIDR